MTLRGDIERLLNKYSAENESNTPDFILAEYVMRSLEAFDMCVRERDRWYGRLGDEPEGDPVGDGGGAVVQRPRLVQRTEDREGGGAGQG